MKERERESERERERERMRQRIKEGGSKINNIYHISYVYHRLSAFLTIIISNHMTFRHLGCITYQYI